MDAAGHGCGVLTSRHFESSSTSTHNFNNRIERPAPGRQFIGTVKGILPTTDLCPGLNGHG